MKPILRKPKVIFTFGSHASENRHGTPKKPGFFTNTVLFEHSSGTRKEPDLVAMRDMKGKFAEEQREYFEAAKKKGARVLAAEYPVNRFEQKGLGLLFERFQNSNLLFNFRPSVNNFKSAVESLVNLNRARDKIAKRMIKESLKEGDVEVRRGSEHANLYHDLKREGVKVERRVVSTQRDALSRVARRLMMKLPVDEKQWRRAFVNSMLEQVVSKLVYEVPLGQAKNFQIEASIAAARAITKTLTEKDIIELANSPVPEMVLTSKGYPMGTDSRSRQMFTEKVMDILNSQPQYKRQIKLIRAAQEPNGIVAK